MASTEYGTRTGTAVPRAPGAFRFGGYTQGGADAAGAYADPFRDLITKDPQIQSVIQRVWGTTPVDQRPSDTPKTLESQNAQASKEIAQILASRGIRLPDRTFINPRSESLEGHRGWAGLSGAQKAAIIAALAATGVGSAAALGAFGGAAGAGAAGGSAATGAGAGTAGTIAGLGSALPVTAGLPAAAGTAAGAGAAAAGAGASAAGTGAGLMSQVARYAPLATMGASALGRAFGGGGDASAGQGARLQDMLPIIMQLLQQSQQSNLQQQQYAQRQQLLTDPGAASLFPGMTAPQGAVPLREAIAQMAYRMLPTYATQGR